MWTFTPLGGTCSDLGDDSRERAIHSHPSGSGDAHILRVHVTSFSKPWGLWPDIDFCPISRTKERVWMMKHWDF